MVNNIRAEDGSKLGRVTIKDIANALSLSRNTVAKGLRKDNSVTKKTQDQIINKAVELGYSDANINNHENGNNGKLKKIIVIKNAVSDEFYDRILVGVSSELAKNNCVMSMYIVSNEENPENKAMLDFIRDEADGVLGINLFSDGFMRELTKYKKAFVYFDKPVNVELSSLGIDTVCMGAMDSIFRLTEKLINMGVREFSFVGDYSYCQSTYDRYVGFVGALNKHSIPLNKKLLICKENTDYYDVEVINSALASLEKLPEAFICLNDELAIRVINYLSGKGLCAQKDYLISGFDDTSAAQSLDLPLTTVKAYNEFIGRRMVQMVIERLGSADKPFETIFVHGELLLRLSTER